MTILPIILAASFVPGGGISAPGRRGNFNPASSSSFPQQAALVNYWKLEEASGNNRADSIGSATLIENLGAVSNTTGKQGSAADFPVSNTYLGSSGFVAIPSAFTVMIWINCSALPAAGDIFFNFDDHVDEFGIVQLLSSGDIVWKPHIDDNTVTMALGSLNAWHMVICQVTGGLGADMKISVDGATFSTATRVAGAVPNAEKWLGFGIEAAYKLDEVAIWNVALSQEEVTTLWNGGSGVFLP